jgi:ATP-binding cassette subfamily F protein 3
LIGASFDFEAATKALADETRPLDSRLAQLDQATERFESRGGFSALDELIALLSRFGLADKPWDTRLDELSGGEKTRAGLAALLASRPDLLLLDEPTNHLDIEALAWLERFVANYPGAVLLVSHDRAFLDSVVNRIIEIDEVTRRASAHHGGYTSYAAEKARARAALADAYAQQQEQIERIQRDIRAVASHAAKTENATTNDFLRGRAKKVARTAKVRERKLERLLASEELIDKPKPKWGLAVDFARAESHGEMVVDASGLRVSFAGRPVLDGVDLHVRAGERIALTGPNGAGKSTLLSVIAGRRPPDQGMVHLGAGVQCGWFDQEQAGVEPNRSALVQVRDAAPGEESEARAFLHKFLFSGESALRAAGLLSYGERARLALALLVRRGANLLLLDEPLNHLDIGARERFEDALTAFDGTVIAVLHDRYAIKRIANRVLEMRDGRLVER